MTFSLQSKVYQIGVIFCQLSILREWHPFQLFEKAVTAVIVGHSLFTPVHIQVNQQRGKLIVTMCCSNNQVRIMLDVKIENVHIPDNSIITVFPVLSAVFNFSTKRRAGIDWATMNLAKALKLTFTNCTALLHFESFLTFTYIVITSRVLATCELDTRH